MGMVRLDAAAEESLDKLAEFMIGSLELSSAAADAVRLGLSNGNACNSAHVRAAWPYQR